MAPNLPTFSHIKLAGVSCDADLLLYCSFNLLKMFARTLAKLAPKIKPGTVLQKGGRKIQASKYSIFIVKNRGNPLLKPFLALPERVLGLVRAPAQRRAPGRVG